MSVLHFFNPCAAWVCDKAALPYACVRDVETERRKEAEDVKSVQLKGRLLKL